MSAFVLQDELKLTRQWVNPNEVCDNISGKYVHQSSKLYYRPTPQISYSISLDPSMKRSLGSRLIFYTCIRDLCLLQMLVYRMGESIELTRLCIIILYHNQGRIELLKAVRGHVTSSTCRVDDKVQNHTHFVLNIVTFTTRVCTTIPGAHTLFLHFAVYNVTCLLAAFSGSMCPCRNVNHVGLYHA